MKGTLLVCFVLASVALSRADGQASGGPSAGCSDPLSVLAAFYRSNDAGRFNASAALLAPDVIFDTWATGANGYIMASKHLGGRRALRDFLSQARGLSHFLPDRRPNGPIFLETRESAAGGTIDLRLDPDRLTPERRHYNAYDIKVVFDGCLIKAITVIERVSWL